MLEKIYFLILATVLGIWGALMLMQRVRGFLHGRCAEGRTVDWKPGSRVAGFYPVVEFQSGDGSTHRVVGGSGSINRTEKEHLPVIYLRREPGKAWIYSFSQFWLPPFVTLFMAVFALAMFLQVQAPDRARRARVAHHQAAHPQALADLSTQPRSQTAP